MKETVTLRMRTVFSTTLLLTSSAVFSQQLEKMITVADVTRIETTLSSDSMDGRAVLSAGIDKAAKFIAEEFANNGLKPFAGSDFFQRFALYKPSVNTANVMVGEARIPDADLLLLSTNEKVTVTFPNKDYKIFKLPAGENPMRSFGPINNYKGKCLVLMHTSHEDFFKRIKRFLATVPEGAENKFFILTENTDAENISIEAIMSPNKSELKNVAAIIPGKSRPEELVIFSAHYDHLGYGKPDANGDSLYNGANDDASGTTAVIALSRYFQKINNNDRSLVFVAFTAEESGGYGSRFFSRTIDPAKAVAMFNIEMIGTDSKWGNNSAYITGFDKSDMGKIMQESLKGSGFDFYPDPYPQQNLFYRSDNATLARLGVPAHTISTSKMDIEPHYHKPSDEIGTLDMNNMTKIIHSIAISASSIISGKQTPSRVALEQ